MLLPLFARHSDTGLFTYPPPSNMTHGAGSNNDTYQVQDTVVPAWEAADSNSTACEVTLLYWLLDQSQDWVSTGWYQVPCAGTRPFALNIVHQRYLGRFILNYTTPSNQSGQFKSAMFTVNDSSSAPAATWAAAAATTPSASASASASSVAAPASSALTPGAMTGLAIGAVALVAISVASGFLIKLRLRRAAARRRNPLENIPGMGWCPSAAEVGIDSGPSNARQAVEKPAASAPDSPAQDAVGPAELCTVRSARVFEVPADREQQPQPYEVPASEASA